MIQNNTAADRRVSGNLTGEDIKMKVGDMSHLMNVVTDLYSDRELACIREYSTNALDAHVEAGVARPIEVTTPTPLMPFLVIRDFGHGLDEDDIREIYSQYGISTKRQTNGQTGMLGLGCKSALSYSDTFTVTSVKNSMQMQVVVSRNANGASMKVVQKPLPTKEPAGTTVTIPVRAHNMFDHKAREFFACWKPGTVLLNGVEPELLPGAQWVSDDIAIVQGGGRSRVVMGGVPYPAPTLSNLGIGYGRSIVAFVEIGAVDFAPSREGLMDTDTTNATLRRVEAKFKACLQQSVVKDLNDAPTPRDRIERWLNWQATLPSAILPTVNLPGTLALPDGSLHTSRVGYYRMSDATETDKAGWKAALGALYVTGFDYASFTATVRKKLDKYCADKGLDDITCYILVKTELSQASKNWIKPFESVDWPTVKAIKLPRNTRSSVSGRIPGSYDIYENGIRQNDTPADDIDTNHPIYYCGSYGSSYLQRVANRLFAAHPKGCTLVPLQERRVDKFCRIFPQAKKAQEYLRTAYQDWESKLDPKAVKAYVAKHNGLDHNLKALGDDYVAKIRDPEVRELSAILSVDTAALQKDVDAWQELGFRFAPQDEGIHDPFDKYRLFPESYYIRRGHSDRDAIVRYMNAEYSFLTAEARS